jgi:hypothetical protein
MKKIIQNAVLALCATILSAVAVEAAWRVYLFHSLRNRIVAQLSAMPGQSAGRSIYDPEMGYRYTPNRSVDYTEHFHVKYHVNEWGSVDDEDYPLQKPKDEFRIVVVGDSFTANINNTVRWTALLQAELNDSQQWKNFVAGKKTRVINLGRDGIGLVQFDKVLLIDGLRFAPDLVLVDFIVDDLIRKPYFRGQLGDMTAQQRENFVQATATKMIWRLPWLTIYPEVFAEITREKILPSRIIGRLQGVNGDRYYADVAEGASVSAAALRHIVAAEPNTLVMVHPQWEDFKGGLPGHYGWAALPLVESDAPEIHIEHMIDRFPHYRNQDELNSWFNVPYDYHMSDKALRIYAGLVAAYLIEQGPDKRRAATSESGRH